MRLRRVALYAVLGLAALVVICILAVLMIDLGRFKPNVESIVSDLTGREFVIGGAFEPSIGTSIHLIAEDVHLGAPAWSEYDDLASLRRLEVSIDTWSLIRGPVRIEFLSVAGARAHLERNEAGEPNWDIPKTRVDDEAPVVPDRRPSLPVVVVEAKVSDFQLTYDSPERSEPLDVVVDEISEAILDSDEVRLSLDGRLNDVDLDMSLSAVPVTNLVEFRDVEFDLDLSLGEIRIAGNGRVDDLVAPSRPDGKFSLSGPNAEYLFQVLKTEPFTSGPLNFNAAIEPDGENMRVTVEGAFGEFDLRSRGRFVNLQELENLELTLEADGPDVGTIIRLVNREYPDKDPFELRANLYRSGPDLAIDGVFLNIGESRFHASGRFKNFPSPGGADARLNVSGPDFGRFNRLFGMPGKLGGPFDLVATLTPQGNDRTELQVESRAEHLQLNLQADLGGGAGLSGSRASVEVTGEDVAVIAAAAGIENAPNESFAVSGVVERVDDGFILNDVTALIGDDRFSFDGIVGNKPLKSTTDLRFDVSGTDIRDTLRTFNVKSERLPDGPFRAVGRVHRIASHFVVENVHASIGADQEYVLSLDGRLTDAEDFRNSQIAVGVRGNSTAAVAELVGLGDVPDVPYNIKATIEREKNAFRVSEGELELGTVRGSVSGLVGDQPTKSNSDLQLSLEVPDLSYSLGRFGIAESNVPAEALTLTGRIRNRAERIWIDRLVVRFAGLNGDISGDLGEIPGMDGTRLELRATGNSLSRLLPDRDAFSELNKKYSVETILRLDEARIALDDLVISLGNLGLEGNVAVARDSIKNSGSFDIKATSPDLFELVPNLAEISIEQVAPMNFSGAGNWQKNYWEFDDVRLELGKGSIYLQGSVDGPPNFDRTDLTFDWNISSLKHFSVLAGRELPDHSAHLTARLSGTRDEMKMEHFVGEIGDSDIDGDFAMRAGDVPEVYAAFTSNRLDLASYLPPLDEEEPGDSGPADGRMIPDTPLPLDLLASFNADIDVTIGELIGRKVTVKDFDIDGTVKSGELIVDSFSLTGRRGGTLAAQARLTPDGEGGADLVMSASGSELILGLHAANTEDLSMLPLYRLSLDASATGSTVRDLAASLDGSLSIVGEEGRIRANSYSIFTGDVFNEVLTTMNPFVQSDPYTHIQCSAILLRFEDGAATGRPAVVQKTDRLLMYANANVNLKNERLRVDLNSVPQRGLGISLSRLVTPYLQVSGTLARPTLSLDPEGTLIEGGAAVATAGLSILAKSFRDRFFSSRDPCGDAVAKHDEAVAEQAAAVN